MVLGRPTFLFPTGCHSIATMQSSFLSFLSTRPIQFHILLRISSLIFLTPVTWEIVSFRMCCGRVKVCTPKIEETHGLGDIFPTKYKGNGKAKQSHKGKEEITTIIITTTKQTTIILASLNISLDAPIIWFGNDILSRYRSEISICSMDLIVVF